MRQPKDLTTNGLGTKSNFSQWREMQSECRALCRIRRATERKTRETYSAFTYLDESYVRSQEDIGKDVKIIAPLHQRGVSKPTLSLALTI